MYVCLCFAITDRQARAAIEGGAGTAGRVLKACGATRPCGGCTPTIRELVREGGEHDSRRVTRIDRYREAR